MTEEAKPKLHALEPPPELVPNASARSSRDDADDYDFAPVRERTGAKHTKQEGLKTLLTPKELIATRPRGEKLSIWKNTTSTTLRFQLYVEPPTDARFAVQRLVGTTDEFTEDRYIPPKFCVVVVKPGATVDLPSEFDEAIHDVREGRIVGGLAPQLRKVGAPHLALHPTFEQTE